MKAKVTVIHHKDADYQIVHQLVTEYGSGLIEGVETNRKHGRAEEAFLLADKHVLAVGARRLAEKLGVQLGDQTQYFIYAVPDGCATAQSIKSHLNADPAIAIVDGDNLTNTSNN